MNSIPIRIERCRPHAILPHYQHENDSGFDLHACLEEPVRLFPRKVAVLPTGLRVAIPAGYEMQIRSRSGLAAKSHLVLTNSPGTIDSGFRGELMLILSNHSEVVYTVRHGDRMAQGVVCPVLRAQWEEGPIGEATERGAGGLGSTGTAR
jgi:dUTP pyrophosphatase